MKKFKFIILCIALIFSIALIMTGCKDNNKDDESMDAKPVIYLYPETMEVTVKLNYNGEIICTYPIYNEGWTVIAHPDGKLINQKMGKSILICFGKAIAILNMIWIRDLL